MRGRIKRLVHDRGFGFIRVDGSKLEYFFHRSECNDYDSLREGQAVDFDEQPSPKGPRAGAVKTVA